ncbi:MAG: Ig-like domain repeat protein [Gemmatales bacterium]
MSAGFRSFVESLFRPNRQQRRAQGNPRRFRPAMEALEDRTVPAVQIIQSQGLNIADLTSAIDQFKLNLGGFEHTSNADAGSTGYRNITFDDATGGAFNGNFYSITQPRGLKLTTDGTGFQVSKTSPANEVRFGNINPTYPSLFKAFSGERLFTPIDSRTTEVTFTVPQSTATAATVRGYGVIFSDVDLLGSTTFQAFDKDGNSLTGADPIEVIPLNNGFSFIGVITTAGERISKVTLVSGNTSLGTNVNETATEDLVVIDNMLYTQPVAVTTPVFLWKDAGADTSWNNPDNWTQTSGTVDGTAANRFPRANGDIAVFSQLTSAKTIDLTSNPTSIGAMQIDTNQSLTFNTAGAGRFSFATPGSGSPSAGLDITTFSGNATVNFNVPVSYTNAWHITTNGGSAVTFAGVLNGSTAVTQWGSGTVNFTTASHTFTGPYNVNGGTVNVTSTLSTARVNLSGGKLTGNGTVGSITANNSAVLEPGTAATIGALNADLSGNSNDVSLTNTTLRIRLSNAGGVNVSDQLIAKGNGQNINLTNTTLQLDLTNYSSAPNTTFTILDVQGTGNASRSGTFTNSAIIQQNGMLFQLDYSDNDKVKIKQISTATTTDLTRSPNNNTSFGDSVDFVATVNTDAGAPTGQVRFDISIGANPPVFSQLVDFNGNTATYTTSALNAAAYTVTATYVPTGLFTASSDTLDHTVNSRNVAVTFTPSSNSAVFTQAVITATVRGAGNNSLIPAGGTVTFVNNDGSVTYGSATINALGQATLPAAAVAAMNVGSYQIRGLFTSTDTNFNNGVLADSGLRTQQVTAAATTTTLSSNPATWNFNQDITFTATVNPANGAITAVPTGSIRFTLVGVPDGMGNPDSIFTVPLAGNSAQLVTQLPAGNGQVVRAAYLPTDPPGNFAASNTQLSQNVNAIAVNISLAPLTNTTVYGQGFAYSATVSPVNAGAPTPTGNVVFTLINGGTTFVSSPVALVNGVADLTQARFANAPSVGTYILRANYLGSAQFLNTTVNFADALTVNRADTTLSLADASGSTGQPISTTATLGIVAPGAGVPGGVIRFILTGPSNLQVDVPVVNAGGVYQATLQRNDLLAGSYTVSSQYLDSTGQFNTSVSNNATITVSKTDAVLTLNPNPQSQFADTVTFTANVVSSLLPSGVAVTGFVQFDMYNVSNGNLVGTGTGTVTNGVASFTAPALLGVGQYQVVARYLGDANYNLTGNQTTLHTITSASTSTGVTLQPLPGSTSTYGEQLSFRATVQSGNPAAGIPTGTVVFRIIRPDGQPDIVSPAIPLNAAGVADHSFTQVLPATEGGAPLQVIATYQGDDVQNRFAPSSNINNPLLQTILRANTAVTFTMKRTSDNAITDFRYSDTVILIANVTTSGLDPASAQRAGIPPGKVQFFYFNGATEVPLGAPVTVNANGEATLSSISLNGKPCPIRLPTGNDQPFRVRYMDTSPVPNFNASLSTQNISVRPLNLVANPVLSVVPKTGSADSRRVYAYGRSLVISVTLRPEVTLTAGKLFNGTAVELIPTGSGVMQFIQPDGTVGFTTPTLQVSAPPRSSTNKSERVIAFTSSALFNNTIGNRNPTSPQSLLLPTGVFTTRLNITSFSNNFANVSNMEFTNSASIFTVTRSTIGRRW